MDLVVGPIEPVLAFARERLMAGKVVDGARRPLLACAKWLRLHRPSSYEVYSASHFLHDKLQPFVARDHIVNVHTDAECVGDLEQISLCIDAIIRSVVLEGDSSLIIDVLCQDDPTDKNGIPCVQLEFDGFGRIPDEIFFGGYIPVTFDTVGARWTEVTRGGRIDRSPTSITMRLRGIRAYEPSSDQYESIRGHLEQAVDLCAAEQAEEALAEVEAALTEIDGLDRAPEPADIKALATEMIKATSGQTEARRIQVQSMFDPALPPLLVKRGRLQTFWGNLFAYAQRAVNEGGSITVTAEYDREHREATLTATFASEMLGALDNVYEASLRRAIEDQDGAFDRTQSDGTVSITAILPDKVAQALNEWIPGYEAFSERSKQVLRLIKSGAPIPSEEVFLAGILEEELERWLLPLLEQPLAVNLAHNLLDGNERRKKALTQIRKGKVKKEIAGPAYAAEILAAYNADDRHRSAVGAQSLGKDGVDRLSKMLGQPTPDYTECLRTIAKCK